MKNSDNLFCGFCDEKFTSMDQLKHHYSVRSHKKNVLKRTRQKNEISVTKFRPPPYDVVMGRYKLCKRFEIEIEIDYYFVKIFQHHTYDYENPFLICYNAENITFVIIVNNSICMLSGQTNGVFKRMLL